MPINPKSHASIDVQASIDRADDTSLSPSDRELTRQHLAYMLTQLKEPSTFIEPTRAALRAMNQRPPDTPSWLRRHIETITIGVIIGVIVGLILYKTHWNSAEPTPTATTPAAPVKP